MSQSTTSQKHEGFCNGPMGNKPNTELPGIGPILGEKLKKKRFPTAQHVFGQFLVCGQDPVKFKKWLKKTCGANEKQQSDCYNACQAWSEQRFQ